MEPDKTAKAAPQRSTVVKVLHWGDSPPSVVFLCGSARYKADMSMGFRALTLGGHIVVMSGAFGPQDSAFIDGDTKKKLDELDLRKIDMSDAVFVVSPNGYVDSDMKRQIEYAEAHGKFVKYIGS